MKCQQHVRSLVSVAKRRPTVVYSDATNMTITDDMKRWASFGMNITWLSRKTGYSRNDLIKAFREGLLTKPFGTKLENYCDYDFFERIDTEAKAYWLGFLYADGCITDGGCINLLLAGYEKDHLAKFKQAINAEHRLEERSDKMTSAKGVTRMQACVKIRLHSKLMCLHLKRLGVGPRKTLSLQFPTSDQVPDHLLHHFIRGYFDGDGCICHCNQDRYHGSWQFSIVSADVFIERLKEVLLKHVKIGSWTIYPHPESEGVSYFSVRCVPDINRLRDYLYRDATVYLERKRLKFAELPVRYFPSLRQEIIETLQDRLTENGLVEFTQADVVRLYQTNRDTAFVPVKRLEKAGTIKRVERRKGTIYYRFAPT